MIPASLGSGRTRRLGRVDVDRRDRLHHRGDKRRVTLLVVIDARGDLDRCICNLPSLVRGPFKSPLSIIWTHGSLR